MSNFIKLLLTLLLFPVLTLTVRAETEAEVIDSDTYLELLRPFAAAMPEYLRAADFDPELRYFGTGEARNWPTQCNSKAFAMLVAMNDDASRDTALRILRYILATHRSGPGRGTDGGQWGGTWISAGGSLGRMAFALDAVKEHLTRDDRAALRRVAISEADYLLDELPIQAGIEAAGGRNKPESNLWNGSFLLRTALEYPEHARAEAYREKGLKLLLNGVCIPADLASDELFGGKPLKSLLAGANFTENYSLDHHGYLNVGYMVTCLANIARLHFDYKERGVAAPPELYRHAKELWQLVKSCTFPDGRLLRIGGDSRVRYAYCQLSCLPVWLFAADYLNDADALDFERRYLELIRREQQYSGDGSFFGRRLARLKADNFQYYCRLEADMLVELAGNAHYRRKFAFRPTGGIPPLTAWRDGFHGGTLRRDGGVVRSWVWRANRGPAGLCLPLDRSDLAEWQHNLAGELATPADCRTFPIRHAFEETAGGWTGSGEVEWRTVPPLAEGEAEYAFARQQLAVAALPDGKTMLIFDRTVITKETTITAAYGVNLKIPNDFFNGLERRYAGADFTARLPGRPKAADDRATGSRILNIDGRLSVFLLYGGGELTIVRPPEPIVRLTRYPYLPSLYADRIAVPAPPRRRRSGEVVIDCGYAVAADTTAAAALSSRFRALALPGLGRGAEFTAFDGVTYRFLANFGDTPIAVDGAELPGGGVRLLALP